MQTDKPKRNKSQFKLSKCGDMFALDIHEMLPFGFYQQKYLIIGHGCLVIVARTIISANCGQLMTLFRSVTLSTVMKFLVSIVVNDTCT